MLFGQGFGGGKLRRITLNHCMNVSSKGLGRLLKSYPAIREVAISGCVQLRELVDLYPQVKWVGNPWAVPQNLDPQRHSGANNKINQRDSGGKREHGDDGHSGCSLDETGYRDKSTEESESPGTNRRIGSMLDPLVKDADASQVGYPSRDSKRLKASAGNGVRNGFGISAGKNDDQQSVGTEDEKEFQLKKRRNAYASKRKLNNKLIIKTQSSTLGSSKKVAVSSQKADNAGKEVLWNPKNTGKDLDKILGKALRVVMDADSEQLFYRSVIQIPRFDFFFIPFTYLCLLLFLVLAKIVIPFMQSSYSPLPWYPCFYFSSLKIEVISYVVWLLLIRY